MVTCCFAYLSSLRARPSSEHAGFRHPATGRAQDAARGCRWTGLISSLYDCTPCTLCDSKSAGLPAPARCFPLSFGLGTRTEHQWRTLVDQAKYAFQRYRTTRLRRQCPGLARTHGPSSRRIFARSRLFGVRQASAFSLSDRCQHSGPGKPMDCVA